MILKKGDRVRVNYRARIAWGMFLPAGWAEGTVLKADNWRRSDQDRWYVEMEADRVSGTPYRTGYHYWKQNEDGGTVEKLS